MPKNPDIQMKPTQEQLTTYIEALEGVNKQLVYSLKQCLKLLANAPPEVADKEKWKNMLDDFNKIAEVGERISKKDKIDKSLH